MQNLRIKKLAYTRDDKKTRLKKGFAYKKCKIILDLFT